MLMDALHASFEIMPDAEITIEANPGTLNETKLREYRAAGINRLSMGLQSTNDALLETIGRIHRYADFVQNYECARAAGFTNISADLMYGLPGQTVRIIWTRSRRYTGLGSIISLRIRSLWRRAHPCIPM